MTINYYSYEELKAAVIAKEEGRKTMSNDERKTLEVEIEKRLTTASESELLVVYWYLVSE